jgi:hypothetical protein
MNHEINLPESLTLLPVPMPPMLDELINLNVESRFVALFYYGSKATWSDGRSSATFPYFTAYELYVYHMAMAVHLFGRHLGSDDLPPRDALLVDRQVERVYLGSYHEVENFLAEQHPPRELTTEEVEAAFDEQLRDLTQRGLDEWRELGMFEVFLGPKPEHQERGRQLVQWLDGFVTEELIEQYLAAANQGNIEAMYHLRRWRERALKQ